MICEHRMVYLPAGASARTYSRESSGGAKSAVGSAGSVRAGPGSHGLSCLPSQEWGSWEALGQAQPQAVDTILGTGKVGGWAGTWAHRWAWFGRVHDWAGLWGAGDRPCCGVTGAGAGGPGGVTWGPGPWSVWRGRAQRGWSGLAVPWGHDMRGKSHIPGVRRSPL